MTACFSQVREIWVQLAWPDSAGAFIFVTRLTDVSATYSVATLTYSYSVHIETWHIQFISQNHKGNWGSCAVMTRLILSTAEFLQWGRVLLRDDNAQDWEEPAGPRPQEFHSAGNACSKTEPGVGTELRQRCQQALCQHKGLSGRADMLYTQKQSSCFLSSSIIYTQTQSLHFSVALLLFLLFFSISTLCFSAFAPPRFLLALHRPEQHRACACFPGSPAPGPGLAGCGARHGGIMRGGGERAGLQGSEWTAVQHGPGSAERS